jgi:Family of unknown function (DUF6152)
MRAMTVQRWISAAALIGLLTGTVAVAHHSNAQFYDSTKKVEAEGSVTKFIFKNPHGFLYIDAPDGTTGQKVEWQIELGAPISLSRTGWTPETIKPGMILKAVGSPSRAEGTRGMCCARITKPDGSPIAPGARTQEENVPR